MAKLTAAARKKIPAKKFGEPKERKYPMPDKAHARNAISRATQQANKGKLAPSKKVHIIAMAHAMLRSR